MSQTGPDIQLKRVYDPPSKDDGRRVLVDRLWPRGLRKEAAKLTVWLKEIAPSPELRYRSRKLRGRNSLVGAWSKKLRRRRFCQ